MKSLIAFVLTMLLGGVLLLEGPTAISGAIEGLSLCANLVIPSTFAFMVVGCFIPLSGFSKWLVFPLRLITRGLLRLPDELGAALIMSFIGGYPAGIKTIATLCDYGMISTDTATRCCYFAVNPSPAFVVTAVGQLLFGNAQIGLIFYLAQIITCLLLGFCFRPRYRNFSGDPSVVLSPEQAFVLAVGNASGAMVTICGFIVFFAVVSALIEKTATSLPPFFSVALSGLLEVTGGCKKAALLPAEQGIYLAIFFISFGGLSIAYQNLSIASGSKIKLPHFIKVRLLSGVISTLLTYFLLKIFPLTQPVMLMPSRPRIIYSMNQGVGTICLLGMAVLLFNMLEKAACRFSRKSDTFHS